MGMRSAFPVQALGIKISNDYLNDNDKNGNCKEMEKKVMDKADDHMKGKDDEINIKRKDRSSFSSSSIASSKAEKTRTTSLPWSPRLGLISVSNEMGMDRFEITIDPEAWLRVIRQILPNGDRNIGGGGKGCDGLDRRWFSGDWTEDIISRNVCNFRDQYHRDGGGKRNLDKSHIFEGNKNKILRKKKSELGST